MHLFAYAVMVYHSGAHQPLWSPPQKTPKIDAFDDDMNLGGAHQAK